MVSSLASLACPSVLIFSLPLAWQALDSIVLMMNECGGAFSTGFGHVGLGPLGSRALGSLGTWAFEHLGLLALGPFGTWAFGHLGLWALGPLGNGPLGTLAFVQNSLECLE